MFDFLMEVAQMIAVCATISVGGTLFCMWMGGFIG